MSVGNIIILVLFSTSICATFGFIIWLLIIYRKLNFFREELFSAKSDYDLMMADLIILQNKYKNKK